MIKEHGIRFTHVAFVDVYVRALQVDPRIWLQTQSLLLELRMQRMAGDVYILVS